jgi:hypothetical protein
MVQKQQTMTAQVKKQDPVNEEEELLKRNFNRFMRMVESKKQAV